MNRLPKLKIILKDVFQEVERSEVRKLLDLDIPFVFIFYDEKYSF